MGFDLYYQAIPADGKLIELARDDVEDGAALGLLPLWLSRDDGAPRPGREGERGNRVWDACCRLAGERPDIGTRSCALDRRWDILHYLLSATRRGEQSSRDDLVVDRAFNAGEPIADHVRGGQGVPVRYLSPTSVADVAAVVEPIDDDALAKRYDPPRMEAGAVYKFWADRADEAEWRWTLEYFERFRAFFIQSARAGDGVIVCLD